MHIPKLINVWTEQFTQSITFQKSPSVTITIGMLSSFFSGGGGGGTEIGIDKHTIHS